jgi:hypothetical protein
MWPQWLTRARHQRTITLDSASGGPQHKLVPSPRLTRQPLTTIPALPVASKSKAPHAPHVHVYAQYACSDGVREDSTCRCWAARVDDEDASVTAVVEEYVPPPVDSTPPVITMLLGDTGRWGNNSDGSTFVFHVVPQHGVFEDPGATAADAHDGDLTAQVCEHQPSVSSLSRSATCMHRGRSPRRLVRFR